MKRPNRAKVMFELDMDTGRVSRGVLSGEEHNATRGIIADIQRAFADRFSGGSKETKGWEK